MEPLTAVSLAGTILQFVEVGSKAVQAISEYRSSSSDLLVEYIEVECVAADLSSLSDKLQHSSLESSDIVLAELCGTCNKLACDILAETERLKIRGRRRPWKCVSKAVLSFWNRAQIADLQRRMSEIRSQLNFHVVVELRYARLLFPTTIPLRRRPNADMHDVCREQVIGIRLQSLPHLQRNHHGAELPIDAPFNSYDVDQPLATNTWKSHQSGNAVPDRVSCMQHCMLGAEFSGSFIASTVTTRAGPNSELVGGNVTMRDYKPAS